MSAEGGLQLGEGMEEIYFGAVSRDAVKREVRRVIRVEM